jgi:multidrug efflux pump subunit AcrB
LDRAGARVLVREPPPLEGVGGEPPLSLYIYGNSQSELLSAANQIRTKLAAVPGTGSVVVDTAGLLEGVSFDVDLSVAARYGVDPRLVFLTGQMVGWGLPVAGAPGESASALGSSAPVSGAAAGASGLWLGFDSAGEPKAGAAAQTPGFVPAGLGAQTLALFERVLVPGQQGSFELKSFLSPQVTRRPFAIDREGQMRKVVIYGAPDGSVALSKVLDGWQRVAEGEGGGSPALRFEVAGDRAMLDEMADSFSLAMLGGVLCVLVALVVLFENLWMPVMVVASLPLAAAGGLLGLSAAGERLAMGSMIGFVLLLGLSAKNAILLVDGIKKYSDRRPLAQRLVVLLAVKNRVRPILMTSFALGVGMLPTIFLRGAGSEFRSPMALCIVSGLVSSTALSFFVIPALCALFLRRGAVRGLAKQARL